MDGSRVLFHGSKLLSVFSKTCSFCEEKQFSDANSRRKHEKQSHKDMWPTDVVAKEDARSMLFKNAEQLIIARQNESSLANDAVSSLEKVELPGCAIGLHAFRTKILESENDEGGTLLTATFSLFLLSLFISLNLCIHIYLIYIIYI